MMHHLSHRTDGKEEESCWRSGPLILVFRAVKIFEKITKEEEEEGTRISLFLLPRYHPEKKKKVRDGAKWLFVIRRTHKRERYTHPSIEYYISRSYYYSFFLCVLFIRLLSNDKSFVSTFLSPFSFPFFFSLSDFLWSFNCNHGWIIKRIVFFFFLSWRVQLWPVFSLHWTPL